MENRGQKYHRGRLGEALREEIVAIVEGELDDPRIGLVAINEVQMAPDGKIARVLVDVAGTEEEAAESIEGLNAARGYIRHELTSRLGKRHTPDVLFVLDRSQQYGGRIEQLLQRIEKRKR
jgi:ribosome-binding factor A